MSEKKVTKKDEDQQELNKTNEPEPQNDGEQQQDEKQTFAQKYPKVANFGKKALKCAKIGGLVLLGAVAGNEYQKHKKSSEQGSPDVIPAGYTEVTNETNNND